MNDTGRHSFIFKDGNTGRHPSRGFQKGINGGHCVTRLQLLDSVDRRLVIDLGAQGDALVLQPSALHCRQLQESSRDLATMFMAENSAFVALQANKKHPIISQSCLRSIQARFRSTPVTTSLLSNHLVNRGQQVRLSMRTV